MYMKLFLAATTVIIEKQYNNTKIRVTKQSGTLYQSLRSNLYAKLEFWFSIICVSRLRKTNQNVVPRILASTRLHSKEYIQL